MSRKNKAARCRDIKDFGKVVSIKKADIMVSEVINEMSWRKYHDILNPYNNHLHL